MNGQFEIIELTTKLNGVILKKAELDQDFEKIYAKVFDKIFEPGYFSSTEDFLEIFGEVSG